MMEVTKEIKRLYLTFFKNGEEFYNAFRFPEFTSKQMLVKKFISVAIQHHSITFASDFTGIIDSPKYHIYFAILPTGDFVYYTINKKSNIKGNYSRIATIQTVYERLIKLGGITSNLSVEEIIASDQELLEWSKINCMDLQEGSIELTLDMSMNVDFLFMDGIASIEYIDEQFECYKVGNIWFKIFNSHHLNLNELRYAADSISDDVHVLMENFLDEYGDEVEFGLKFLTLDCIKVERNYRNKGIGRQAIKELIKVCKVLDIQYILLQPTPMENSGFRYTEKNIRKREISKLLTYIEKLGFVKYQQKGKEPFMVFEVGKF